MKKILYIVLDGLSDLPVKELKNKTPLESANTPCLDSIAKKSKLCSVYPVKKGVAPESDIAVISLLGYDLHDSYTGRGPLESFAEGLVVNEGDLALRVNFASVKEDGRTIVDRRAGRNLTTEEASELSEEINSKVSLSSATFELKNTIGHRGVLVIRCVRSRLSGWITNTDPAYERNGVFSIAREKFEKKLLESLPMSGYENNPQVKEAARLVNEFTEKTHKVLNSSIVNQKRVSEGKPSGNIILCRDAGNRLPSFISLKELYGFKFASLVEMPVERGIALLTGMNIIDVPTRTGDLDIDYGVWAKLALEGMKKFDGLYVHIKGPDEPAHDGDFLKKKKVIEAIDKFFFKKLLKNVGLEDTIIAISSDHTTACSLKAHTSDSVPLLVCGTDIKSDGISSFSEEKAREGSLGLLEGKDIMKFLSSCAR